MKEDDVIRAYVMSVAFYTCIWGDCPKIPKVLLQPQSSWVFLSFCGFASHGLLSLIGSRFSLYHLSLEFQVSTCGIRPEVYDLSLETSDEKQEVIISRTSFKVSSF